MQPLLDFFGYPERAATELHSGTLKLRYSSIYPSSKRDASWPVPNLASSGTPAVGASPGPKFHFLTKTL